MEVISKSKDLLFSETEVWLVRSEHVDDIFRVCVTAPGRPLSQGKRAGVVVATDAELSAGSLISTLRSCAVGLDLPALYGVSIGYPLNANPPFALRRTRDLTPTSWPVFDPVMPAMMGIAGNTTSGGCNAFLAFIEEELKPALAASFPIDTADATLTGQSFGGLFVLHTLLHRPGAFRRYLAVSPSLWWGEGVLLHAAKGLSTNISSSSPLVYMCAGELETQSRFQSQIDALPEEIRSILPLAMTKVDMHGDMLAMDKILKTSGAGRLRSEAYIYPEESHESIMGAAFSRGLRRLYGNL